MSASDKSKLDSVDDTYALKSLYGDTTINVGRKAGSTVGKYSTAEGRNITASSWASHAEGEGTTASSDYSHAEGKSTAASGLYSHAEGRGTTASGAGSHAEGSMTTASGGFSSHAEGANTTASGDCSHAEGSHTTASGANSHAGGIGTKALHDNEAAYGKYNKSNDNTLFSIGDGTADDARHNAFEITKTGGKLHDKDIATTDLIPTSLPANGGNADTLNGMDAETIRSMSKNVESGTSATSSQLADGTYCGIWADVPSYLSDTQGTLIVSNYHTNGAPSPWSHRIFYSPHYNTIWHGFISNYNWYGWKEISTTPIKSTTFSGTTDAYSNIALWAKSENKIPILFECEDKNAAVFYGKSGNFYAYVTDNLHQNVVETAVSGTVWYVKV